MKKIAVGAGIAIVAVAVLVVFRSRPACVAVERSVSIAAPPAPVQSRIANLQQWTTWSPWERAGADFDRKFEGPLAGAGATYSWSGGEDVGAGRLTVVSAGPSEVQVQSRIERPRPESSDYRFVLLSEEKGTRVTWTASCGATAADLDRGLGGLKAVAEAEAAIETYQVARSTTIQASADEVRSHLVDLRHWTDWSAREALDRRMREQFAGRAMEPGSTYNWWGGDAVGSGRLTLLAVEPAKVTLEVKVDRPVPSSSDLEFTLAPDGKGTRVTWTIAGEKDDAGKAFGLYSVPLERFADDMDDCLARLKLLVEAGSLDAAR